jgi:nucleotidyltransferase/DNA polymerase involved in DNA repair
MTAGRLPPVVVMGSGVAEGAGGGGVTGNVADSGARAVRLISAARSQAHVSRFTAGPPVSSLSLSALVTDDRVTVTSERKGYSCDVADQSRTLGSSAQASRRISATGADWQVSFLYRLLTTQRAEGFDSRGAARSDGD